MFINKDEKVHRFALSAISGELLKRERNREIVRDRERERGSEVKQKNSARKKM